MDKHNATNYDMLTPADRTAIAKKLRIKAGYDDGRHPTVKLSCCFGDDGQEQMKRASQAFFLRT